MGQLIFEQTRIEEAETKYFLVKKSNGEELGDVAWNENLKGYHYYPHVHDRYSAAMLEEIGRFIEELSGTNPPV